MLDSDDKEACRVIARSLIDQHGASPDWLTITEHVDDYLEGYDTFENTRELHDAMVNRIEELISNAIIAITFQPIADDD